MDEGLDPQVKLKLLEAARAAEPDYPDVKKGLGCGAAALVVALAVSVFIVSFFRQLTLGSKISIAAGTALIAAMIAGGLAAFRPPSK